MKKRALFIACVLFFPVFPATAASLFLSPDSGTQQIGKEFSVSINVESADQSMNAASGVVNFSADTLSVVSLSKTNSIFNLWVQEPSYSNTTGKINFEGIVLNPGFIGAKGRLLTITFKPIKTGTALISFTSPLVLANDGSGANILKNSRGGAFSIVEATRNTEESASPNIVVNEALEGSLLITSKTHPDQTKWYPSTEASFIWELPEGARAVRMQLDNKPYTAPTFSYGPFNYKEVSGIDQGISYFHLRAQTAKGWGDTEHYKIQIDTSKPNSFKVTEIPRVDLSIRKVRFTLEAEDEISGIDHYEIALDGKKTELKASGGDIFETEELTIGHHTLYVKAVDKAGNYLDETLVFKVEQPIIFTIGKWAFSTLAIIIPLLLIIFLLATLVVYLYFKFNIFRRQMRRESDEAEEVLKKSIALIKEDVKSGNSEKEIIEDLLEAEKVIKKEIRDITNPKKVSGKKMSEVKEEANENNKEK